MTDTKAGGTRLRVPLIEDKTLVAIPRRRELQQHPRVTFDPAASVAGLLELGCGSGSWQRSALNLEWL